MTNNKGEKKEFTFSDIIEARKAVAQKHFYIIQYLLNKNSKPTSEGGINYQQFFDDMQDFESNLIEDI